MLNDVKHLDALQRAFNEMVRFAHHDNAPTA